MLYYELRNNNLVLAERLWSADGHPVQDCSLREMDVGTATLEGGNGRLRRAEWSGWK